MEKFRLEAPTLAREQDALEYIEEFRANNSEIHGVGGLDKFLDDYPGWLKKLDKFANYVADDKYVPSRTFFLVRESDNRIVGMVDIRLALTVSLWNYGGNIGYSIRPSERRKGYNKINLYLALKFCDEYGLEAVLLHCDKENLGSSKTMRALGGKMIFELYDEKEGKTFQNFIIDVKESLKNHKEFESQISK